MAFSGIPQRPKPPTISVMPSWMPSNAATGSFTTLFMFKIQMEVQTRRQFRVVVLPHSRIPTGRNQLEG